LEVEQRDSRGCNRSSKTALTINNLFFYISLKQSASAAEEERPADFKKGTILKELNQMQGMLQF